MKKVFLSLITIAMFLSLSLVLVKAEGETAVTMTDGVQIRTDEFKGLRWEATVENPVEGAEYGMVFVQGDLTQFDVSTEGAYVASVDELNEQNGFKVSMVNFPKEALVQDISVKAFVKIGEEYIYSANVVTRNLSEVAVEAYEKGVEGEFVKEIYDASLTNLSLNGGTLRFSSYSMSDYNHFYSDNGVMLHGKGRCNSSGSAAWAGYYDRIFMKYDADLGAYRVVATNSDNWTFANFANQDYDLVLMNSDGATNSNFVEKLAKSANVKDFIFKIDSDVEFDYTVATKNIPANIVINVFATEEEFLADTTGVLHLGGGEKVPTASKAYYDFKGWYNNAEFAGNPIETQGLDRKLFAKFTPINYSISYVLGNGQWVAGYEAPNSYNYESSEIALPDANKVSINNGIFLGWYASADGKGDAITSIPANSNGNVKLYAIWQMNEPILLELSNVDKTIIEKYQPTIFVSEKFGTGEFIINGNTYVSGENLFTNITAALNAANENDIIYVFSGDYNETVNITVAGVTLLGANADVDPNTSERQQEATIKKLTVNASNVTFNGFYFVDGLEKEVESIAISAGASNCNIAYTIIANQTMFNTNSNGLIKISGNAGKEVNNLTIQNVKVEKGKLRPTLIYGFGINNLTVKDSVFLGSGSDYLYTDAVKIIASGNYGVKGNITFTGNTFKDYGQYLLWFASCSSVNINVTDNQFINCGQSATNHAAVYVASAASSFESATVKMENNIVDDSYMLFRVAKVAKFTSDNFKAELHYNSVINCQANVYIKNESLGLVNAANNYYGGTPTDSKFTGVATWDPYLTEDPNK